jgi:succinate dehydrogenase/fumarate reductase flavoprotein subunit
MNQHQYDVVVVGSGGSGFTAAIAARKQGLSVLMVEKDPQFGGTTAFSGGVLWIPGNHHSPELGTDNREDALTYITQEAGNHFDRERVEAFLDNGPEMVAFLEHETEVRFYPFAYPDYHPWYAGSRATRSIGIHDYKPSALGRHRKNLKQGLVQTQFMGVAVGSNVEMKQLMSAGRSLKGMAFVARKLLKAFGETLRYGRPEPITRGRALIGRLAVSAFGMGIDMWLSSPATELITENGRVTGLMVNRKGQPIEVRATSGVILASGGFPHDETRTSQLYAHKKAGRRHVSLASPGNTGDGACMAEKLGGFVETEVQQYSAWMPVSLIPGVPGPFGIWPHIVDRQRAGFICVTRKGTRFTNESQPYHDFVPRLVDACTDLDETCCFLICDHATIRRNGMGYVKPAPVPMGAQLRSGYLLKGNTLAELAAQAGIDAAALEKTVARFNAQAHIGEDPDFGRGGNIYDHSQGDLEHKPNPNLGPIEQGPFYAVKIVPGDIGNFAGIRTDAHARVVTREGHPIEGLYACGNDALSFISGGYAGAGGTLGPGMTLAFIAGRHIAGV